MTKSQQKYLNWTTRHYPSIKKRFRLCTQKLLALSKHFSRIKEQMSLGKPLNVWDDPIGPKDWIWIYIQPLLLCIIISSALCFPCMSFHRRSPFGMCNRSNRSALAHQKWTCSVGCKIFVGARYRLESTDSNNRTRCIFAPIGAY